MQILTHIKRGIVAGSIKNGDELPSRRTLSALLGVNPNTVQKAYRILEDEGLVQSHSGAKSYMLLTQEATAQVRGELLHSDADNIVSAMRQMGLSLEEAIDLIKSHWN